MYERTIVSRPPRKHVDALPHRWNEPRPTGEVKCGRCQSLQTPGNASQLCEMFPPCERCGEDVMNELACPNARGLCVDCCGEGDH